jgi:hypothetical protein
MFTSLIVRVVLVAVILVPGVWLSTGSRALACSCIPDAAQMVLEQNRQGVVAYQVGEKDGALVYMVMRSFGVALPEQLTVPKYLCNTWGVGPTRQGFSVNSIEDGWAFSACSGTSSTHMDAMASDLGLQRYDPIPVANLMQFDADGAEIMIAQPVNSPGSPGGSSGFKAEYGIIAGVLLLILILMGVRTRWGPDAS